MSLVPSTFPFFHDISLLPSSVEENIQKRKFEDFKHLACINCSAFSLLIPGIILFVSSLFLSLAAFQILPNGVNAICHLKTFGKVLGIWGVISGVLLAGLSSVWFVQKRSFQQVLKEKKKLQQIEKEELNSYLYTTLSKTNSIIALDDHVKREVCFYYIKNEKMIFCTYIYENCPHEKLSQFFEDSKLDPSTPFWRIN